MILKIEAYNENGYETLMEQKISAVDNWERILRKMYDWVWKHCNQNLVIELYAIMINEEGLHELSQAWAIEYDKNDPLCELPFC